MKALSGTVGWGYAGAVMDVWEGGGLRPNTQAFGMGVGDVWPTIPPVYRDAMPRGPSDMSFAVTDAARQLTQAAQAEAVALARAARERVAAMFPTWTVDGEAVSDSPASALTERAEQWGADLIAIGSHGRGAMSRLFFGSISQKGFRYSHCLVRVGRDIQDPLSGAPRLLLCLDTSQGAAAAAAVGSA